MADKDAGLKVFIDNGHDTIKCCQVDSDDCQKPLNHFEIPTQFVKELVTMKKESY